MVFKAAGTLNSQGITMNEQLLVEARKLQSDLAWFINACNTIHETDAQMLVNLSFVLSDLIKGYEHESTVQH